MKAGHLKVLIGTKGACEEKKCPEDNSDWQPEC